MKRLLTQGTGCATRFGVVSYYQNFLCHFGADGFIWCSDVSSLWCPLCERQLQHRRRLLSLTHVTSVGDDDVYVGVDLTGACVWKEIPVDDWIDEVWVVTVDEWEPATKPKHGKSLSYVVINNTEIPKMLFQLKIPFWCFSFISKGKVNKLDWTLTSKLYRFNIECWQGIFPKKQKLQQRKEAEGFWKLESKSWACKNPRVLTQMHPSDETALKWVSKSAFPREEML